MTGPGRYGVALVALALGAAGCGFGESAEMPPVPDEVSSGGTLTIGIPTPVSIDPAQASDAASQLVVAAMCDPILEIDPSTGEIYGGLSRHVVSEGDGMGLTVTLHGGLRFPDGEKASVNDVRDSLSRIASDEVASPLAVNLEPVAGFDEVHGDIAADEDDRGRTRLRGLSQVTSDVFSVGLAERDPEFGVNLTRPWSAVVPPDTARSESFADKPICVGPYQMDAPWSPGEEEIRLVRNEHHKAINAAHTGGGAGYPDTIVFRVYPSEEAAYEAFGRGEVDLARVPDSRVGTDPERGTVVTAATNSVEYIGLPTTVAPFSDVRIRLALSMALDRQALIDSLAPHDRVVPAGMFPPTFSDALTDIPACRAAAPASPDVAGARQLLADADADLTGVEIPIYVNDEEGSGNVALAEAVAAQWRDTLGVATKVVALPWKAYLEQGRDGSGFDGAFRTSWRTDAPSPLGFVVPLLSSGAIGTTNLSRYSSPQLDTAYERHLSKETDTEVRNESIAEEMSLVCGELPLIPVWSGTLSYAVADHVGSATGEFQRASTGELDIRELYLTAESAAGS